MTCNSEFQREALDLLRTMDVRLANIEKAVAFPPRVVYGDVVASDYEAAAAAVDRMRKRQTKRGKEEGESCG